MSGPLGVLGVPAFRRYWTGETISFTGSQVTELALPLTAVVLLAATPAQMGLLSAIGYAPFLLFGLLAGVWVDRFPRRLILIATDLAAGLAVMTVPLAALAGVLGLPLLFGVGFLLGTKEVLGRVASQSLIPTLVGRAHLVEANARLEASSSVAVIVGPALGGFLIQALSAPVTLAVDAVSYLVSAAFLRSIAVAEPARERNADRAPIRSEIAAGLRLVAGSPLLRALVSGGAIHNFFSRMIDALYVLYAVDTLHLGPAEVGLTFAAGGPGALLGSMLAGRLSRGLGAGRTIAWLQIATGLARLLIPLAGAPGIAAVVLLSASNFLIGAVRTAFNVTQVSLRIAITPDHLHGRMNATVRFLMWGVTPIGALAGGLLATSALGIRATLLIAALGTIVAVRPFLASELRRVREIPALP